LAKWKITILAPPSHDSENHWNGAGIIFVHLNGAFEVYSHLLSALAMLLGQPWASPERSGAGVGLPAHKLRAPCQIWAGAALHYLRDRMPVVEREVA